MTAASVGVAGMRSRQVGSGVSAGWRASVAVGAWVECRSLSAASVCLTSFWLAGCCCVLVDLSSALLPELADDDDEEDEDEGRSDIGATAMGEGERMEIEALVGAMCRFESADGHRAVGWRAVLLLRACAWLKCACCSSWPAGAGICCACGCCCTFLLALLLSMCWCFCCHACSVTSSVACT